ncbi:MAG: tRNA pseudouridine(55) synthase TruB [Bacteroidota bacterium]|jgi:tRNA pseudouridine55 synthase|nr:tRNA pseudouridine(55) synthase TruB [Bacteroidota bacterium]|tara:strand:+ start:8472 stop:9167 length:696 start_codon:yes stop_codon:yes gene_type:complete
MSFLDKYNNGQTLLVDKDLDWTSFDVVKKIKNIIKCKKVGHAGTLDPLATGLLIICTGKNTKKINDIQNQDKVYTGEFILGKSTPSHDLETEFNSQKDIKNITSDRIEEVSKRFVGEQLQRPPKFSAVKVNGKRAYEYARDNEEVKIKEKNINIYEFKITEFNLPNISFKISCTKGTYIRSIARDFGEKLGCGAVLSKLRRTEIGNYNVEDAFKVNDLADKLKKEKIESNN